MSKDQFYFPVLLTPPLLNYDSDWISVLGPAVAVAQGSQM